MNHVVEPVPLRTERLLGAWPVGNGTCFRVWAPKASKLDVVVERSGREPAAFPLDRSVDGFFAGWIPGVYAGDCYRYRIDGGHAFPDPASRFQPQGVHGPSEIVDATTFEWTDHDWRGIARDDLSIYELHIGAFTAEGTFAAAMEKLPHLVDLGVTAIETMPLAQCPGLRNWGYDGVDLFAPAHAFGRPDDVRRFVDEAHRLGLAVLIDVVYNHLGPEGNYLGVYSPFYASQTHHTDWGEALNFDGPGSEHVREFFIENAIHWIRDYHFDGLRLDATHIIQDDSPRHFLAELTARVRAAAAGRRILVIAEDYRNWANMYRPESEGGWNLDGVWADAFHHHVRRFYTGDHEAYYRDYSGATADIATTIRQGWFYCGQESIEFGGPHGTDPTPLDYPQFVVSIQNHDQIGNRATGDRLNHAIQPAEFRAATLLLLGSPLTPLLFMGQEWAADSPFQFFTDHHEELGRLVTAGRRNEFRHFKSFSSPEAQATIPDPQAEATFVQSKLRWDELPQPAHLAVFHLYQRLLHLRRGEPAWRRATRQGFSVHAPDDATIVMSRFSARPPLIIVTRLRGPGRVTLTLPPELNGFTWSVLLTTEDAPFALDPMPIEIDPTFIHFPRAGGVVLKGVQEEL